MCDLNNRGQKNADIASTYIQVLIGLSSGIITVMLAFYSDISKIQGLDLHLLKYSMISLGVSIFGGLIGLGGLVNSVAESNREIPTTSYWVRISVGSQLIAFAMGILLVIVSIP